MSRRNKHYVRRCLWCGYKTHRMFWRNEKCPICGKARGYVESEHGALSEEEMKKAREKVQKQDRENSSLSSAQRGC